MTHCYKIPYTLHKKNTTFNYCSKFYLFVESPCSFEEPGTGRLESFAVACERGPGAPGWQLSGLQVPCHSSPEKVGRGQVDSGPLRELEETGAVRTQETLSSHSPIEVDWVKAFRDGVKQFWTQWTADGSLMNWKKYNTQIPCHVVGFVANICFLLGIMWTLAFLWFLVVIFNISFVRRDASNSSVEAPDALCKVWHSFHESPVSC